MRVLRGLLAASWIAVLSIGLFHGCSSEPAQTGSVDSPPAAKTRTVVVPPPVLSTLTDVALLDRKGNDFGPQEFGGKVWITNFIFTRCAGVCPRQSEALSKLQPTLAAMADSDRLGWMSVSVDPEFDRPDVMDAYGSRWNADPRWRFLTGTRAEIWAWVKEGFRLPVSDNPEPNGMPILHSSKFVLVDAQGRVRGYYESLEPDGLARLPQDLQFVLDEQEDALAEAAEAAAASPLPKRREPENDRTAE